MCGFAGYIHNYGTFDKEEVIHKMADRIKHRGPDDAHYYIDDGIALGFRRLSIIDLEGGRQPILNEDGSLVLLFNGEIYNYQELREELIKVGHVFTTKTDSETILHGYEEYGKKILDRLRGMFAFIIWNKNTKELFGARDIFGIKPFYYYKKGKEFMFKGRERAMRRKVIKGGACIPLRPIFSLWFVFPLRQGFHERVSPALDGLSIISHPDGVK